jgi:hypothetical protein
VCLTDQPGTQAFTFWGSLDSTPPQDPLNFQPRQTTIHRYDDSSNGSIDDDEHGGVAPDVVHELGRCVPARALKSSGYCGGEVV